MKSETHLSARITDDGRRHIAVYGPADKLLELLEEEACAVFMKLKDECYPDTLEVMCRTLKNIAERVFNDDL